MLLGVAAGLGAGAVFLLLLERSEPVTYLRGAHSEAGELAVPFVLGVAVLASLHAACVTSLSIERHPAPHLAYAAALLVVLGCLYATGVAPMNIRHPKVWSVYAPTIIAAGGVTFAASWTAVLALRRLYLRRWPQPDREAESE
jgi:hypothetical protein